MVTAKNKDKYSLTIKNNLTEISKIVNAIDLLSNKWSFPVKLSNHLNLAIEELFANIVFYAFDDSKEQTIYIEFLKNDKTLTIKIIDTGRPFDILKSKLEVDVNAAIENRKVGGLGIHLVKTFIDSIDYERRDGRNVVKLTKKI